MVAPHSLYHTILLNVSVTGPEPRRAAVPYPEEVNDLNLANMALWHMWRDVRGGRSVRTAEFVYW